MFKKNQLTLSLSFLTLFLITSSYAEKNHKHEQRVRPNSPPSQESMAKHPSPPAEQVKVPREQVPDNPPTKQVRKHHKRILDNPPLAPAPELASPRRQKRVPQQEPPISNNVLIHRPRISPQITGSQRHVDRNFFTGTLARD
jgi:hypothetical protein